MRKLSIAIDGPAGAGKSSVAKIIARRLGYTYLDTGAMYRAITWLFLEKKAEKEALPQLARESAMTVAPADGGIAISLSGRDVTPYLRTPEVSAHVSEVAAVPEVRKVLVDLQRAFAAEGGTVMDGRDIGTVVLPDADVKVFLTASPRTRAIRRYKEIHEKEPELSLDDIEENIRRRDEIDSTRKTSPLRPADDAVCLDNSDMTLEETAEAIISLCKKAGDGAC